jgi:hypothetical protein
VSIFQTTSEQAKDFDLFPETFPAAQLAYVIHGTIRSYGLVVGGQIVVVFDGRLTEELEQFFAVTWREPSSINPNWPPAIQQAVRQRAKTIVGRYQAWFETIDLCDDVYPVAADRPTTLALLSSPPPPSPPTRPTLVPGGPYAGRPFTTTYGHVAFSTDVEDHEAFYRWEPWPTSRRVLQTDKARNIPAHVVPWTFAAPAAEVQFMPTGFAAVARSALPSLFPAVFRWEIQPTIDPPTPILCGATVPMFGQSGGGVEVCFPKGATNKCEIADPIVIDPL